MSEYIYLFQDTKTKISIVFFFYFREDLYSNISVPLVPVVPTIDVTELIKQSSVEAGWDSPMLGGGVLSSSHTSHILCGLSQEVDRSVLPLKAKRR